MRAKKDPKTGNAEKRKQGHCLPQLPDSIRAPFSQIATFSFFRFGVGGVVAR